MNTKSGVFTRGFVTRENTAFSVFGEIKNRSYTEKIKYPLCLQVCHFHVKNVQFRRNQFPKVVKILPTLMNSNSRQKCNIATPVILVPAGVKLTKHLYRII